MTAVSDRGRSSAFRQRSHDQFHRWADSYDRSWLNALVFFPTLRVCEEEIIRWQSQRGGQPFALLDVGCGTGNLLALLGRHPACVQRVGLDYSPAMLGIFAEKRSGSCAAAETAGATDQGARPWLVQGDSERLPFADGSFEVLTCCHSFHHYPHQADVVREMHRVLRPGGLLLLVDGFRDNVIGWLIFDLVVASVEQHVHHAPWSQVREQIRAAGFSDLRQRKLNVLAPLLVNVAHR